MKYKEKEFSINHLNGVSEKQIKEHLNLYLGYVKHTNLVKEKINKLLEDKENNSYIISELRRRFSFEFNGMRMHEYYFEELEGGFKKLDKNSKLLKALSEKYGSLELTISHIEEVAMTRGIGWTVLYYDHIDKTFHVVWVDNHELRQLGGLSIIMVLDMWEHAFMVDYASGEKEKYINAFFNNLNWGVLEKRFNDDII